MVRFQYAGAPGSSVCVVGTFNGWDPAANPLKAKSDSGVYATQVFLPAGRHEYKFLVDGRWCSDPTCPDFVVNPYGTLNSVISV
jgi:1,4-alpha-glucan branching enzyme